MGPFVLLFLHPVFLNSKKVLLWHIKPDKHNSERYRFVIYVQCDEYQLVRVLLVSFTAFRHKILFICQCCNTFGERKSNCSDSPLNTIKIIPAPLRVIVVKKRSSHCTTFISSFDSFFGYQKQPNLYASTGSNVERPNAGLG